MCNIYFQEGERMKKIIPIFLIIIFFSCNTGTHSVTTYLNDEIESPIREEINAVQKGFLKAANDMNYDEVKSFFSTNFIEENKATLNNSLDQLCQIVSGTKFSVDKEYYSKINLVGKNNVITIIPSFSDDALFINSQKAYNPELFSLFLKSETTGLQYLLLLIISKYDDDWKIDGIHYGHYGIQGLTAPELYQKTKELIKIDHNISAVFYALSINYFLRPIHFLQYNSEKEYSDFVNSFIAAQSEEIDFPIKLSKIEIIGFNIEIVSDYGLIPVIKYVTETDLEENSLKNEIEIYKSEILEALPNIEDDFTTIIFSAFNELPIDPNKQYRTYNTIINF